MIFSELDKSIRFGDKVLVTTNDGTVLSGFFGDFEQPDEDSPGCIQVDFDSRPGVDIDFPDIMSVIKIEG